MCLHSTTLNDMAFSAFLAHDAVVSLRTTTTNGSATNRSLCGKSIHRGRSGSTYVQPSRTSISMVAQKPLTRTEPAELKVAKKVDVQIYDTTLRDGTQGEGISLSVADKLKVTVALDKFGMAYIEGGWPGANPKDDAFFEQCKQVELKHSKLVAFGMTRMKGNICANDKSIQSLVNADTPVVTIVGKTSLYHVERVLETTLDENLAMIRDTVEYLKTAGKEVMLDAEHFFDGYKDDRDVALKCLNAAVEAGVDVLVLCDTNGGSLPDEIRNATKDVCEVFPNCRVGIHTHNDCDLAVANSIAAVAGGATVVQGTCNGYGERTGNANLMSIIPTLQLKTGRVCVSDGIRGLTQLSRYVDEVANQKHVPGRPFVGVSSFAHKGGLHAAAVHKLPNSYQHIEPAEVGNERRVLVSELAGRRNIVDKARELGLEAHVDTERAREVLTKVKQLEAKGYSFEGAEASVELMIRRTTDSYRPPFELLDYTILTGSKRLGDAEGETQATVKLALLGPGEGTEACPTKRCIEVGEGEGPVDAFHNAVCRTLKEVYKPLRNIQLADYKVRILDNESGTAATTRVMVDFVDNDNGRRWTTVAAHPNIITASVNALMDGFEFAMIHKLPQCIL